MQVLSNLFPILVRPDATAYRHFVSFTGISKDGKSKCFTGNAENDSHNDKSRMFLEKRLCYCLLSRILQFNNIFKINDAQIVYDNRSTLYCTAKLPSIDAFQFDNKSQPLLKYCGFETIEVKLTFLHELKLDFREYEGARNAEAKEMEIKAFFELITDQPSLDNSVAIFDRNEIYFLDKFKYAGPGFRFFQGVKKQCRLVRDRQKGFALKLVMDPIISPFWNAGRLSEAMVDFFERHGLSDRSVTGFLSLFRNVCVTYEYNEKKLMHIRKLSEEPASNLTFTDKNQNVVKLVDYFEKKYGKPLEFPQFPVLVDELTGCMYPPELLTVIPKKVSKEKLDIAGVAADAVLKLNAMRPPERYQLTMDLAEILPKGTTMFADFGFEVDYTANLLDATMAAQPQIQYQRSVEKPNEKSAFRQGRFLESVAPSRWAVVAGFGIADDIIDQFLSKIQAEFVNRGNPWPKDPIVARLDTRGSSMSDYENWKRLFGKLAGDGVEFAYFIDAHAKVDSHGHIKLFEQQYGIVTQHILKPTVVNLRSFYNPVCKSNCKSGGVNYNIKMGPSKLATYFKDDKCLIIGYDVAHARSNLGNFLFPSVVGASYNCGSNSQTFVGDYFYQRHQTEIVDSARFTEMVFNALQIRKETRNAPQPELIVVYRDGLSEGQYQMAMSAECAAIKEGFAKFYPDATFEMLFLIATKHHNRRFYSMDRQNTMPGTTIKDGAIRVNSKGFYLQSAYAIQGTAKYGDYEVLENTCGFTAKEIVDFTNGACYLHQIVLSATSQPTPVYLAHEFAKRGTDNLKTYSRYERIPANGTDIDFDFLNDRLTYKNSALRVVRFNA